MKKEKIKKIKASAQHSGAELLKNFSSNGIKINSSLLMLYKKFSAFGLIFITCTIAQAQTELKHISGEFNGRTVKIFWATSSENKSNFFSIERSVNGKDFEAVGLVKASGNSSSKINYSFVDKNYFSNIIYYRIKITDTGRHEKVLGSIVAVQVSEGVKEISVYPVTSLPGMIYVEVSKLNSEKIIVDVSDPDGQKIVSKTIERAVSEPVFELQSFNLLAKGNHTITSFFENRVIKCTIKVSGTEQNSSENTEAGQKLFTLK